MKNFKKQIIVGLTTIVLSTNLLALENSKAEYTIGVGGTDETNDKLLNIGIVGYKNYQSSVRLGFGANVAFSSNDNPFTDGYISIGKVIGKNSIDLLGGITATSIGNTSYAGYSVGVKYQRALITNHKIELSYLKSTLEAETLTSDIDISRVNLNYVYAFRTE